MYWLYMMSRLIVIIRCERFIIRLCYSHIKIFSRPFHSWLHHSDATVGQVGAVMVESSGKRGGEREGESSDKLEVHAILSEATLGKFMAKFGNSVSITETQ